MDHKKEIDKRHGGPYNRGSADSYYGRDFNPHYFEGGTYQSKRIDKHSMTKKEIEEYTQGFNDNEDSGDFKQWAQI